MNVNIKAFCAEIVPVGISLIAVLGFFASIVRSRYLLNAMAALRAKTMQRMTRRKYNPAVQILASPEEIWAVKESLEKRKMPDSKSLFKLFVLFKFHWPSLYPVPDSVKRPRKKTNHRKRHCENGMGKFYKT